MRIVLLILWTVVGIIATILIAGCSIQPQLIPAGETAVRAPQGYIHYCARHPDRKECGGDASASDQLYGVQTQVNSYPYVDDLTRYGAPEYWEVIDENGGDCEDYALAKLRALLDLGWPIESLRLATAILKDGGLHAILLADLNGQTWVLDNQRGTPSEFQLMTFQWEKIQQAGTTSWKKVSFK